MKGWQKEIHRENAQFTNCADVSMDRVCKGKFTEKRMFTKFTNCADVSMDGELAMGTLINGQSLAQTTFAPATNTKAQIQINLVTLFQYP